MLASCPLAAGQNEVSFVGLSSVAGGMITRERVVHALAVDCPGIFG